MKKYLFSLIALLVAFTFAQAQKIEASETRTLPSFHKIKSGGAIEVVLVQGTQESAKIVAKNIPLQEIQTEVRAGELVLETGYKKYRNHTSIKIEVTYRQLESIKVSGASSLKAETTLKAENLAIDLSGAGSMTLPVETIKLTANISGAGSITIKGKTDNQNIEVSGAGVYKGYDLASLNATARISGAGNARITVSGNLQGDISGAGNLCYKGNPTNKDIHKSGAGSAKATE